MKKLAEVNIQPLRIAFDHWSLRDIYEKSIRTAVKSVFAYFGHRVGNNQRFYISPPAESLLADFCNGRAAENGRYFKRFTLALIAVNGSLTVYNLVSVAVALLLERNKGELTVFSVKILCFMLS